MGSVVAETRVVELSSVVTFVGGGTPSKSRPEFFRGEIPWISPKDMKGTEIFDSQDRITQEAIECSATKLIAPGAVLIVVRSGVLKHSLPVAINRVPVAINQDMKALQCSGEVRPEYLAHFLRAFASEILSRVRGTTADNIPIDYLKAIEIPLPPLAEQRRIAAILDKADALFFRRQLGIAKLQSVFPSLFLTMFGDPSTENQWKRVPLCQLTTIASGSTPSRSVASNFGRGTPWLKTTEVEGGAVSSTEEEVTELGIRSARLTVFPKGSIIVALYGQGATRGRCALLGIDATVNQACGVIVPADSFEPLFLFWQLKMGYERLRALGRGGNQPNLNLGLLGDFRVIVPPIESQRAFVRAANSLDEALRKQIKSRWSLERLFASLQHRGFRGEL